MAAGCLRAMSRSSQTSGDELRGAYRDSAEVMLQAATSSFELRTASARAAPRRREPAARADARPIRSSVGVRLPPGRRAPAAIGRRRPGRAEQELRLAAQAMQLRRAGRAERARGRPPRRGARDAAGGATARSTARSPSATTCGRRTSCSSERNKRLLDRVVGAAGVASCCFSLSCCSSAGSSGRSAACALAARAVGAGDLQHPARLAPARRARPAGGRVRLDGRPPRADHQRRLEELAHRDPLTEPRQPPPLPGAARRGARARAARDGPPAGRGAARHRRLQARQRAARASLRRRAARQRRRRPALGHARAWPWWPAWAATSSALVLPDVDGRRALALAEAARTRRRSARRPCRGSLRCSAGIACYPEDAQGRRRAAPAGRRRAVVGQGERPRAHAPLRPRARLRGHRGAARGLRRADRAARRGAAGVPADRVAGQRRGGRLRGAGPLRRASPALPPSWWFSQAHRFGLGAALEAEAVRAALAAERPPARHLPVGQPEPVGAGVDRGRASCCRPTCSGVVIEITEEERVLDVGGAPAPSRSAARARRAHRGGRRRGGLRRPAAGDEHARRHHQARPRARGRRPHRPGEDRADRLAGALRAQHRRARSAPRASRRSRSCACWSTSASPTGRAGRSAAPAGRWGRTSTPRRRAICRELRSERDQGRAAGAAAAEGRLTSGLSTLAMLARLGAMFERTASVRDETTSRTVLAGRGARDQRGARLPRGRGQRLPRRLRRHAHRRRRGLGRVDPAAGRHDLAPPHLDAAVHAALSTPRRRLLRARTASSTGTRSAWTPTCPSWSRATIPTPGCRATRCSCRCATRATRCWA